MTKRNKSLFQNASHFLLQISSVLIRNVTASTKMQLQFHCKKKKKKKKNVGFTTKCGGNIAIKLYYPFSLCHIPFSRTLICIKPTWACIQC